MPKYDVRTTQGFSDAMAYLHKLRAELHLNVRPSLWLEARGWKQDGVYRGTMNWVTPEARVAQGYFKTLPQNLAINCQLWWNMEEAGLIEKDVISVTGVFVTPSEGKPRNQ